jgi:hypothetical protein
MYIISGYSEQGSGVPGTSHGKFEHTLHLPTAPSPAALPVFRVLLFVVTLCALSTVLTCWPPTRGGDGCTQLGDLSAKHGALNASGATELTATFRDTGLPLTGRPMCPHLTLCVSVYICVCVCV